MAPWLTISSRNLCPTMPLPITIIFFLVVINFSYLSLGYPKKFLMQLPDVYVINESFPSEACIIRKLKNLDKA
jgi:hypothetical protein